MRIAAITIFPEMIHSYMKEGVVGRAAVKGLVSMDVRDLRDYTDDRHRSVDDYPYGGGPGMVMKPDPLARAIESVKSDGQPTRTIFVTPQGRRFDQRMAEELSREARRLLFVCGRYEGIDQRVVEEFAEEQVSVGDYVLSGGELAALVIIDASVRLLPGVVGDAGSLVDESFSWGLLDYPHYTRPPVWRGREVPEALLSGDHKRIARMRRKEALRATLRLRPEFLQKAGLDKDDYKLLEEINKEEEAR